MMQASKCRHDHTKNLMAFQKEKKAVVTEGKNHVKQESFYKACGFCLCFELVNKVLNK